MDELSGGTSKPSHSYRHPQGSKSAIRIQLSEQHASQQLIFQQQPKQCSEHRQQLLFCCFDCRDMVCCARCVSIGKHRNHDVKNLHRSYVLVETSLSEFLIRLGAKIDLYSLYHEKLTISKTETIENFGEVQRKIAAQFKSVRQQLQQKQIEIMALVDTQCTLKQQEFNNTLAQIRTKIKLCMESHSQIQKHIKELSEVSLCKFYAEKKDYIESLLGENLADAPTNIHPQRHHINILVQNFQRTLQAVNSLKLANVSIYQRKRGGVGRGSVDLQSRIGNSKYTPQQRKYIRQSIPNTPLMQTPKSREADELKEPTTIKHSKSRQVIIAQCKQSRKTLKMFSMPSSPLKEKKESPLHYLQLQKRSFILGKKNC